MKYAGITLKCHINIDGNMHVLIDDPQTWETIVQWQLNGGHVGFVFVPPPKDQPDARGIDQ